ncbi:MAG: hypothetical protein JW751_31840 [Polyangiaceae bacterium]|nr:hypothetical protein [Polyangiaceae bacterium]
MSAGECGDGRVNAYTEQCDDGNAVSGDGCTGDCASAVIPLRDLAVATGFEARATERWSLSSVCALPR